MAVADTISTNRLVPSTSTTSVSQDTQPARQTESTVVGEVLAAPDRLDSGTPGTATVDPTFGRTLPTGGEPPARGVASNDPSTSAAWQTVFGGQPDGQATNQLMDEVAVIKATQKDEGAQEASAGRGLTQSASAQTAAGASKLPDGKLTANADGSITTPGGYTIFNDGSHQWRIQEPDGHVHRVWGDPHVDENNDGTNDWNFDTDASFILPDGSKIFCDTSKVNTFGGKDVTTSDTLQIQYLDSLGTMNVDTGAPGTVGTGALAYDSAHGDGDVFVLAQDHRFVDGATLGDLYDAGGDFAVDVNTNEKGTISDLARITLQAALGERAPSSPSRDVVADTNALTPTLSDMVANVYANLSTTDSGERRGAGSKSATAGTTKPTSTTPVGLKSTLSSLRPSITESSGDEHDKERTQPVTGTR